MLALVAPGGYIKGMAGGRKTVAAPGTAVPLASSTNCTGVVVQALLTNLGNLFVGGPDVKATAGSENGIELVPGQSVTMYVTDPSLIYLDAENAGEGSCYLLLKG